jgi:hypothetical protein
MGHFPPVDNPRQLFAALTKAKSFRDHPVIGDTALNARGLHRWRVTTTAQLAEDRRQRLRHRLDGDDAKALDRDGFVIKRQYLEPSLFARLREAVFAEARPAREMRQAQTVTRLTPLNGHGLGPARSLARQPELANLMGYAAGRSGSPAYGIQTIIAEPDYGQPDPQSTLHADTFHPTSKLWLFLTDVSEDDGPFVFVPGSHRVTPERLEWEHEQSLKAASDPRPLHALGSFRLKGPDELASLGYGAPTRVVVPANTLVVANTYGFHHRAPSSRHTVRVEFHGHLRRNPFLPWNGWDPASLVGTAHWQMFFAWLDFRGRYLGKGTGWKACGNVSVDAPSNV